MPVLPHVGVGIIETRQLQHQIRDKEAYGCQSRDPADDREPACRI